MDYQKYKVKVEYGVSAVVMLVGVFFIIQAFTIDTTREVVGPRTLPMILAISIVAGGLFLAARALGKAGDLRDGYGFLESDTRRIFLVIACGALFVFCFWAIGYFVALIVTFCCNVNNIWREKLDKKITRRADCSIYLSMAFHGDHVVKRSQRRAV